MTQNNSTRGQRSCTQYPTENGGRYDSLLWWGNPHQDDMRQIQYGQSQYQQSLQTINPLFKTSYEYSVAHTTRADPGLNNDYQDPTNQWRTWVAKDLKNGHSMQQSAERWQLMKESPERWQQHKNNTTSNNKQNYEVY